MHGSQRGDCQRWRFPTRREDPDRPAALCERAKTPTGKQPYAIGLKGGGLMAMAGLWETWRSPEGERIRSFTIATTTPNELCAKLHNRMPVVLKPEAWPAWLGEEPADPAQLKALLAPTLPMTWSPGRSARASATSKTTIRR